jgi:CheY-like chemotaxis protein
MPARILIVEDDLVSLELVSYLLRAHGHTPIAARDGAEGLVAAARDRPDLILCDLVMPRLDGYEVARRLKSHPATRSIPLVAVTASAMQGERDRALAAGFDGYITKPIAPASFAADVELMLVNHGKNSL